MAWQPYKRATRREVMLSALQYLASPRLTDLLDVCLESGPVAYLPRRVRL
jgi:hypothetical protein